MFTYYLCVLISIWYENCEYCYIWIICLFANIDPLENIVASIKMSISGKELISGIPPVKPDVIYVREGMNVTLFCVMEGAPPPYVTTFKLRAVYGSDHYRHTADKELGSSLIILCRIWTTQRFHLGLLAITKVTPDDEDSYLCSESLLSDTVQLKVQSMLFRYQVWISMPFTNDQDDWVSLRGQRIFESVDWAQRLGLRVSVLIQISHPNGTLMGSWEHRVCRLVEVCISYVCCIHGLRISLSFLVDNLFFIGTY